MFLVLFSKYFTYVGESCNTLRMRMNGHRQTIDHRNLDVPVGHHFNLPGHSLDDLNVLVLKDKLHNVNARRKAEVQFIFKFKTHVGGLNRDIGFMANYKSHIPL